MLRRASIDIDEARRWGTQEQGQDDNRQRQWSPDEEDMTLAVATIAWSYPDPISLESIAARYDDEVCTVLDKLKGMYSRNPEKLKN